MPTILTTISVTDADVASEFREYRDEKGVSSTAVLQELLENIDN
jgi:hypothetical protein